MITKDSLEEPCRQKIASPGGALLLALLARCSEDLELFEGERGAERVVRAEFPSGMAWLFEGEKGAEERMVREEG